MHENQPYTYVYVLCSEPTHMYACYMSAGFSKEVEEICGQWVPWKGEVSSGMEEQELSTEALYDEGFQTRQDDQCCHVSH